MPAPTRYHYGLLGAIDWVHASWEGRFYPPELPSEWRLGFYGSNFECVYLPFARWQVAPEQLAVWRQDSPDHFRFLLELPDSREYDAPRLAALGDKAVPLDAQSRARLAWLEPGADWRRLAGRLRQLAANPPFFLVSASNDLALLQQARDLLEVLGY